MKKKLKPSSNDITQVYKILSVVAIIFLLVVSALTYWAHRFTSDMVQRELAAQKIYFPELGSPRLSPDEFPELQQYAGQLVDTPKEAQAYANGFIGKHLEKVADGKVYAEVSAESAKNPTDEKLLAQKQTLFQGETLRGMLLSNGYAFGTIGYVFKIASLVTLVGAGLMTILVISLSKKTV